jgi:hypothetical protein
MSDRIRAAVEVLARTGWTKRTFADEAGRHCLQGALYVAHGIPVCAGGQLRTPLTPGMAADVWVVNHVIEEQYPERFGAVGIARFNDHPDTTVDDVIRVLEKAAARTDEVA